MDTRDYKWRSNPADRELLKYPDQFVAWLNKLEGRTTKLGNATSKKEKITDVKITNLGGDVAAERSARIAADVALGGRIDQETSDRINAIAAEVAARAQGDTDTLTSANNYTDTQIASIDFDKYEVVASLPAPSAADRHTMYLIQKTATPLVYEKYVLNNAGTGFYDLGDTANVDLSPYRTSAAQDVIDTALGTRITNLDTATTTKFTNIEDYETVASYEEYRNTGSTNYLVTTYTNPASPPAGVSGKTVIALLVEP
jgi:hypothetical protein